MRKRRADIWLLERIGGRVGRYKAGHHTERQLPKLPMRKRAAGEMWL